MTRSIWRHCAAGAICLSLLAACSEQTPVFHDNEAPQRLSDWNLFELDADKLTPVADTLVFRPASTLFTDYAQKLRSLWIPAGSQAQVVDGELVYPVGTVLTKTFYYPEAAGTVLKQADLRHQAINLHSSRVLETRLLVKQAAGWKAYPYVWNDDETEAFLRVAGASTDLTLSSDRENQDFTYFVPNQNQCSGCHQTEHPDGEMRPLGARLPHLAAAFDLSAESRQIDELVQRGWLAGFEDAPAPVDWNDSSQTLADRAQAYLNMNCGHCHNPEGPADTSALILDGSAGTRAQMGICKPPVAAGGGAGDLLYSIVPGNPDNSILHYRMQSREPDEMMPELGRSLVHREGLELISSWISGLPGTCD